ncbi:MAG: hypothetical protein ACJ0P8_05635 [Flavobacteriales bacterium]|tara:strand:+ start:966 stop:1799 length:834 start_codon:yes stop_codon:yes gene_type:complete
MNEEINIRQIFSEFVHFNKRNKSLIFVFILAGIVSVILFQNLKPAYYETKAICMSGISEYERLEQLEELSQRTAVDLINYLQINIANKDYGQLSDLLSIDKDMTEKIKHIEAEQLYQQDMNEKYYALNKFEISLSVFDNTIIDDVQKGLITYFNNNSFIKQYHKMYIDGNNRLINEIDKEINVLSEMRIQGAKNSLDLSSVNIISGKEDKTISNQIISLVQLKEDATTNISLLKPLFFVQDFAKTNKTERDIMLWSVLGGFISYLFSLIISFIKELN